MGPIAMAACIVLGFGIFAWSSGKKWRLLKVGAPENRFDRFGTRLGKMLSIALLQKK